MQVCIFSPVFVLYGLALYEAVARKRENIAPPFIIFVTKVTKSRLSTVYVDKLSPPQKKKVGEEQRLILTKLE